MSCPKCRSNEIYRKDPKSLTVYCSGCNHTWQAQRSLVALLKTTVYSRKPPKGNHQVTVWHCPIDSTKFSFGVSFGAGIMVFEQFAAHPYYCGMFDTPEAALEAGRKYVLED